VQNSIGENFIIACTTPRMMLYSNFKWVFRVPQAIKWVFMR